uniref:Uncharacterized protein n=1 Tax=Poecilia latipinna TaxID=48699 RepID=A0A3B3TTN3_9TELE
MMQTSCPVDGDVTNLEERAGREAQHPPVVSHVERVEALGEALHVVGADLLQEVDVVLGVEAAHVVLRGFVRLEDLTGVQHQAVSQGQTVRLHGVTRTWASEDVGVTDTQNRTCADLPTACLTLECLVKLFDLLPLQPSVSPLHDVSSPAARQQGFAGFQPLCIIYHRPDR